MIKINGIEIDFDITSPRDVLRLDAAEKNVAAKSETIQDPPKNEKDPEYLTKYAAWLNTILKLFGDFIDDAFGDGVAKKLLTNNPSLTKVFEVNEQISGAMGGHASSVVESFNKYKPNRATRRSK